MTWTKVNDGNERNEAREASAGDRLAVADADRSLRTPEAPTDAARMAHNATHVPFRDWCPICGAIRGKKFSAQTSCGEQDSGNFAEIPDTIHVHSNSGREQNSAMFHIRGNAQWSGDQLQVRSERWLRGSDERNPSTF